MQRFMVDPSLDLLPLLLSNVQAETSFSLPPSWVTFCLPCPRRVSVSNMSSSLGECRYQGCYWLAESWRGGEVEVRCCSLAVGPWGCCEPAALWPSSWRLPPHSDSPGDRKESNNFRWQFWSSSTLLFCVFFNALLLLQMFPKRLVCRCFLPSCRLPQTEPGVPPAGHICYLDEDKTASRQHRRNL